MFHCQANMQVKREGKDTSKEQTPLASQSAIFAHVMLHKKQYFIRTKTTEA